ncbi:MAG TPA: hypothetical protein VM427_03760 [Patescibacteria group bacterium]|nr:hypothetical protein [Patescibacteria group bacterium]
MNRILAVCLPTADLAFNERVRQVIAEDRWNPDAPGAVDVVQAILRQSYPTATVVGRDGISAGGIRRTIVLEVYRDGVPGTRDGRLARARAVYDACATRVYRIAVATLGEGLDAETVVERAFAELWPDLDGLSLAAAEAVVTAAGRRLADEGRAARREPASTSTADAPVAPPLAGASLRIGPRRRTLRADTLARLPSAEREALELAVLADLKIGAIAERLQTTAQVVQRVLRSALLGAGSNAPLTAASTLERWRHTQRQWMRLPADDSTRPAASAAVAHTWLDYQVASGGVSADTTVVITDSDRRFVAATANAGATFGRPSIIGLRIDDVTPAYARPLLPDLWTIFDEVGGMEGDYDCDRSGQDPVRLPFRGVWARPIPTLQVGYIGRGTAPLAGAPAG